VKTAAILVAAAVIAAPAAHAETRLVVPGTAPVNDTVSALTGGMTAAQSTAFIPNIGANWSPGTTAQVVNYPASLLPVIDPPTLGQSISIGTANLDAAIKAAPGPIVVSGLSQGAVVIDAEQAALATDPHAPPANNVTFVTFGDPERGVMMYLPVGLKALGFTVTRAPVSQYNTDVVVGQYDFWANPPTRPWNLLADANAIAGIKYAHTPSSLAYKSQAVLTSQTTNARGGVTTTYLVPAKQLPLTEPLRSLGVPTKIVDRVDKALRPIIDAGYRPTKRKP
jgi:hypothetical protein